MAASGDNKKIHANAQREYFRTRVAAFLQPIPEEIRARTQRIAESADLSKSSKILDVGTGTGAMIAHYLSLGVKEKNITGVDLSSEMLENARKRFPNVNFLKADILDADAVIGSPDQFDAAFFNACFGNLYDQKSALQKTAALIRPKGSIIISHPLGKRFVRALHESDPDIVPFLLPEKDQLQIWAKELNLSIAEYVDEPNFYLVRLLKN